MRRAAIAAGVLVLLAADAPAHAQFRGGLTSRPSAPVAVPRSPAAPSLPLLPVSWPWSVVMLPDATMLPPPRAIDGGPTGGVQLDVLPWSAQVYVDGVLAGRVEQFRGYYRHLELTAGPHVLTIVHPGSAPLVVDLAIVPGRTITYRGSLR